MDDLFDRIRSAPAPDEGPSYDDLPNNAWVVGATATEENGGAKPEIRTYEAKDTGEDIYQFNIGVLAKGGNSLLKADKHNNATAFFSAWVNPTEEQQAKGLMVSGRLAGFMNATLSAGIEDADKEVRKTKRWENTLDALNKVREEKGLSGDDFGGDAAVYLAGLFVAALESEGSSRRLLYKVKHRKYDGGMSIEVGSVEDDTPANRANRKVNPFDQEAAGTPAVASSGPTF